MATASLPVGLASLSRAWNKVPWPVLGCQLSVAWAVRALARPLHGFPVACPTLPLVCATLGPDCPRPAMPLVWFARCLLSRRQGYPLNGLRMGWAARCLGCP